jgi:hypothetical protein
MSEIKKIKTVSQETIIKDAVDFILSRDDDDNLLNPHLNTFESELYLKLSSRDCSGGEIEMLTYQNNLKLALLEAITRVVENTHK